jgi:tetratricopeptide (TPR) repeat protein
VVVGDHGEGLGDHGEALHGNLMYQGVMRVPMIMAGTGVAVAEVRTPVSVRRVFDTILAWAGIDSGFDLLEPDAEVVLAEALKPFLQYGWQPQVMAVYGSTKVIQAGEMEVYDLHADPAEAEDLGAGFEVDPAILEAIRTYEVAPDLGESSGSALDEESRRQLASLGYVGWEGRAVARADAPSPRSMVHLFDDLDEGSRLFARQQYAASIRAFERVLVEDDENLMVTVRLAVSHSLLGHERQAERLFERAHQIDPGSIDLKHFHAMHHFRLQRWSVAAPLFEEVLEAMPRRLPAIEALARIRERQGRLEEAASLLRRTIALKESPAAEWARLGELEMAAGRTEAAISAFEEARALQGEQFGSSLELGVCYLAASRPRAAAEELDRVPAAHPGYAMALFKRAQASVLLGESDWRSRVRLAYQQADPELRRLIENERLFQGMPLP